MGHQQVGVQHLGPQVEVGVVIGQNNLALALVDDQPVVEILLEKFLVSGVAKGAEKLLFFGKIEFGDVSPDVGH